MTHLQYDIEYSGLLRDMGIKQATDHADAVVSSWTDIAYDHFRMYLEKMERGAEFQIEDFREYMGTRLVEPPSRRAYGAIAVRAVKDGLIVKIGHSQVRNVRAHLCYASVWKKI